MEHHTPTPAYDHISVSNRAREMRAVEMARLTRAIAARVSRLWADLTHSGSHQPA